MPMRSKKLLIGITGGIGSGKTLASGFFEKLGYSVIHADKIAKELYSTNKQLIKNLVREFGRGILDEAGKFSPTAARKIIFSNKANIKRVNSAVHPFVYKEMDRLVKSADSRIVFIEAAIMFETGSYKRLDYVILIYTNKANRIKRVKSRDYLTTAEIENIMSLQMPEKDKMKLADFIIKNNGTPSDLYKKIKAFNKILLQL